MVCTVVIVVGCCAPPLIEGHGSDGAISNPELVFWELRLV